MDGIAPSVTGENRSHEQIPVQQKRNSKTGFKLPKASRSVPVKSNLFKGLSHRWKRGSRLYNQCSRPTNFLRWIHVDSTCVKLRGPKCSFRWNSTFSGGRCIRLRQCRRRHPLPPRKRVCSQRRHGRGNITRRMRGISMDHLLGSRCDRMTLSLCCQSNGILGLWNMHRWYMDSIMCLIHRIRLIIRRFLQKAYLRLLRFCRPHTGLR